MCRLTIATDVLEGEKKLESGCDTHQNSEVKMIGSALQISEEQLNILEGIPTLESYV